jgi:hypothetical protein
MLVTPDGQWVLPGSSEFLAALGDPDPDYDAEAFAIKNRGFIKFEIAERSIIEIELHPRNVELPALLAVQQQLLSAQVKLFRLRFLETSWRSEISASAEQMIERLSELCVPPPMPQPITERFHVEPRDFSALFDDEQNPLRPLAQKWRISFGRFDPSIIPLALKHELLSRMAIIGIHPNGQEPTFRFLGDGHRWTARDYNVNGIGEPVRNMPDKEYGTWAAEFYRSVAHTGQPRLDLVTAKMQYEAEPGKPRRVMRYERLLLPWKTPSTEIFVSSCAKLVEEDAPVANFDEWKWESSGRKLARSS